jgi:hypothetical protein
MQLAGMAKKLSHCITIMPLGNIHIQLDVIGVYRSHPHRLEISLHPDTNENSLYTAHAPPLRS